MKDELIDQYKEIHQSNSWGNTSLDLHGDYIRTIFLEKKPLTILDYGCGQSPLSFYLAENVKSIEKAFRYDPSIPEIDTLPKEKIDWVINTDVLEHIPEKNIDEFLNSIKSISKKVIFLIHMYEASTVLPNGQNAHCTIHEKSWWGNKLKQHFENLDSLPHHSGKHCFFSTEKIPLKTKLICGLVYVRLFLLRLFRFIKRKSKI